MLSISETLKLDNVVDLKEELKEHVRVRNQMGGALHWNILNDECVQMANKCLELGADRSELSEILGAGTHY